MMQQEENQTNPAKGFGEEQRQRQKKFIAYVVVVIVGAMVLWLIFAPSADQAIAQQQGFNTEVPAPTDQQLAADKRAAYQEEQFTQKQEARAQQMQDLASMFSARAKDDGGMPEIEPQPSYSEGSARPREAITASANAYKDINRTLGNFYEQPKEDPQKAALEKKVEDLNALLEQSENHKPKNTVEDPVALMEKSYQLAAKYFPQNQGTNAATPSAPEPQSRADEGKVGVVSVGQVPIRVVSILAQPMSDSAFVAAYTQERNHSFHTAVAAEVASSKNTIKACVHDNQTITDGGAVRMRLLEPMRAGATVVPKNALITGLGKIQGERLGIQITALEYQGALISVELTVVDSDGQEGIFIPGSMELDALREVAANLGGNLGTTINLNQQGAGEQLLTDLGKGAIQGVSQYVSKKMRTVKVHLKAGYNLMLYQKIN